MTIKKLVATLKVASIPAPYQVALNGGSNKGVKMGDDVVLLRKVDILDPDSGDSLGEVSYTKLSLHVTYVGEKFCIAKVATPAPSVGSYGTPKIKRVKDVTLEPILADASTTLITLGETAKVRREQKAGAPSSDEDSADE